MLRVIADQLARLPAGAREAGLYAAAIASTKALALLMAPVFTRFLSPADYGRLDILQSLADLFSIVIGFGLADTLFRFAGSARSEQEKARIVGEILGFALLTTIAFVLVLQLSAPFIRGLLPGEQNLLDLRLILLSLSLSALILAPMAALRQSGRAGLFAGATFGRAALQAGLALLLLSWGFGVTGALLAGVIAASSLCVFVFFLQARATPVRAPRELSGSLIRYAAPLISVGLAAFLVRGAEKFFLADAVGPAGLAEYALAAKIALASLIFVQPVEMWFFAKRFDMLKAVDGPDRCARAARLGAALAFAAAGVATLAGGAFILLLTPAPYHNAVIFLPLLTLTAAAHATTGFFNLGLYAGNTTFALLKVEVAVAAIALTVYSLTIAPFGAPGAATSVLMVTIIRFAAVFTVAQRARRIPYEIGSVLATAAPAFIGSVASFLLLREAGPGLAGLVPALVGSALTVAIAASAHWTMARRVAESALSRTAFLRSRRFASESPPSI